MFCVGPRRVCGRHASQKASDPFYSCFLQIIAAQEEMLKKERELEEARKKLAQIRQQQYKFLPTELREDEG